MCATELFQTTKIQIFESNSQLGSMGGIQNQSCFKLQRYKFLKAIHNPGQRHHPPAAVVSNYKDTNF